jgi:hypothetical protein
LKILSFLVQLFKKDNRLDSLTNELKKQTYLENSYMNGFIDGIILSQSILENTEPKFLQDLKLTRRTNDERN